MYFKGNLKFLLKEKGIKQNAFGVFIDVSGASVGTYLKGPTTPDYYTLIKIAEYFKISIDDLILKDIEKVGFAPRVTLYVDEEMPAAPVLNGGVTLPHKQQQTFDALLDAKIEAKVLELLSKHK